MGAYRKTFFEESEKSSQWEKKMEKEGAEKILMFDGDKCTGCRVCELTCSMAKWGEYRPQRSYIQVLKNWEMDVNIVTLDLHCDACNECVKWCAPRAIWFVSPEEAATTRHQRPIGIFPAPYSSRR
jgi:Fe-S-cluster-containing dehydrogenase component